MAGVWCCHLSRPHILAASCTASWLAVFSQPRVCPSGTVMTEGCALIPVSVWKPTPHFPRVWSCSGSSLKSPGQEQRHRRMQVQTPHGSLVLNRQRLVQSMRSHAEQQVRTVSFGAERRNRKLAVPLFRKNQPSYVSLRAQKAPEARPCSALSTCQVLPHTMSTSVCKAEQSHPLRHDCYT